jgi:hypothetical protein
LFNFSIPCRLQTFAAKRCDDFSDFEDSMTDFTLTEQPVKSIPPAVINFKPKIDN